MGLEKRKSGFNNKKRGQNVQKNNKNAINNAYFNKICKDFVNWINGIQEDEPLKTEAKNIYFLLEQNQNDFVLSYSADERIFGILDYGAYFPLEAEYLYSAALKELSKSVFENKTLCKSSVVALLKKVVRSSVTCFDFFIGRSVYFGIRLSKNQADNCLVTL